MTTSTISAARAGIPRAVRLSPEAHEQIITRMVQNRAAAREAGAGDLGDGFRAAARIARNELVEAYHEYVVRTNRRAAANTTAAAEQLGEAFIGCIEAIDAYDPASGVPLSAWIASRHAITGEKVRQAGSPLTVGTADQRRQNVKAGSVIYPASFETPTVTGTLGDDLVDTAILPDAAVESLALVTDISAAVRRLPVRVAETVRSYYGLGGAEPRSASSIAAETGATVSTIKSRIARGRQAIAETTPELAAFLAA